MQQTAHTREHTSLRRDSAFSTIQLSISVIFLCIETQATAPGEGIQKTCWFTRRNWGDCTARKGEGGCGESDEIGGSLEQGVWEEKRRKGGWEVGTNLKTPFHWNKHSRDTARPTPMDRPAAMNTPSVFATAIQLTISCAMIDCANPAAPALLPGVVAPTLHCRIDSITHATGFSRLDQQINTHNTHIHTHTHTYTHTHKHKHTQVCTLTHAYAHTQRCVRREGWRMGMGVGGRGTGR